MQTPEYKLKTKRQQITLANKAIQEWTRNSVTDGQSVIIEHNMYNNACSIAHSNGACSVNKVYIKKYGHTYLHTNVHTYIITYKRTYVHNYIQTYIRTYILTYKRTYVHNYIQTYIRT